MTARILGVYRAAIAALVITIAAPLFYVAPVSALGIEIVDVRSSGASQRVLEAGDLLTVDLRLENPQRIDMVGLQVVASGHDTRSICCREGALRWVDGENSASFFNTVAFGNQAFGGFSSARAPTDRHAIYFIPDDPEELQARLRTVVALGSVSLTTVNGTGLDDIGVDGRRTSDGDAHVRLRYEALPTAQDVTLNLVFGVSDWLGYSALGAYGQVIPFRNDEWQVTILASEEPIPNPEPGIAVLLGLGLMGLGFVPAQGQRARVDRR